ncbi:MAG: hypothetical protein CVU31_08860 [Betaproteobacteria bacterium HGW-Betaproteobacteria-4]|nr:MAG: hypothetical protein CVU31_08860 [Betaproteobacteria bacterium HGW-Betaproteobacteria-4]
MKIDTYTDEQRRTLINLDQYYSAFRDAEIELRRLGNPLHWKTVNGKDYLYEIIDSRGNAKGRGPRSPETERLHAEWHQTRDRRNGAKEAIGEVGRLYRALRLGSISPEAAAILREADIRSMLGRSVVVVGTNAMPAYEIEAQARIGTGLDETQDFDMAWIGGLELLNAGARQNPIWDILKAVDPTYTINQERNFQARNAKAYEIELLVAPSRAGTLVAGDKPAPLALPEQEWLLNGTFVDHVVCARDGSPARIVAPDPRWFALHKLWMSDQEKRNPLKRPKDRKQGERLLNAIADFMPHYRLDAAFEAELPDELHPYFAAWREQNPKKSASPGLAW